MFYQCVTVASPSASGVTYTWAQLNYANSNLPYTGTSGAATGVVSTPTAAPATASNGSAGSGVVSTASGTGVASVISTPKPTSGAVGRIESSFGALAVGLVIVGLIV